MKTTTLLAIFLVAGFTSVSQATPANDLRGAQQASRARAKAGDLPGAIDSLRQAVAAAETNSVRPRDLAPALDELGDLLWMGDRKPEARGVLNRSLALKEKSLGPNAAEVADTLDILANTYRLPDERAEMLGTLSRSRRVRETAFGAKDYRVAPSVVQLATYYHALGDANAESLYREAIELSEPNHFEPEGAGLSALAGLAQFLQEHGRAAEAQAVRDRFNAEVEINEKGLRF